MSLSEFGQQIIVNIHLKYHCYKLLLSCGIHVCKNGVKVFWKALLPAGTKAFSHLSPGQTAFSLAFHISKTFYAPHSQETGASWSGTPQDGVISSQRPPLSFCRRKAKTPGNVCLHLGTFSHHGVSPNSLTLY